MPGDCVCDSFEEHEILARQSNSPADHDALPFFDKSSFHVGLGTGYINSAKSGFLAAISHLRQTFIDAFRDPVTSESREERIAEIDFPRINSNQQHLLRSWQVLHIGEINCCVGMSSLLGGPQIGRL